MPENEILAEIHRHREELARSCGYDVKKLMDYYRHREAQPEVPEHKLVSYTPAPPPGQSDLVLREQSSGPKEVPSAKPPCPPGG
jgi:hypothetical protein